MMLSLALFLFCFGAAVYAEPYTVPEARIEVFRPRGLRISIPDNEGIRLFAVHAVVNRDLNGLEAGDISQDILKKKNGRWVYEDKKIKLNYGDVLNYWLFVIKKNLGYRLDDQTYTATEFEDAPPNFINNGKGPSRKPTTESSQYVPTASFLPFPCNCEPSTKAPPPPTCATPTSTVPPPPTPPADLAIWRELLVNISKENENYRQQLSVLYDNNQLLLSKLQKLGDENLLKLRLEGQVLNDSNSVDLIKTILLEKLNILDTLIVKNAVRNSDGSITFELRSIDDKLMVLRAAKEKLEGAKFSIKDIEAISFTDNNDKHIIDQRVKPQ